MADQGPLVRVDTDGRGNFINMTRKQADEYIAGHSGASIAAAREPVSDEVTVESFTAPAEDASTASTTTTTTETKSTKK
ncbi:MAG: hypothetical protein ACR2NO_05635 [Chloroflexota bacterium]